MPIQIRELVIKVVVEDGNYKRTNFNIDNTSMLSREELIYECVEQTLKRLEQLKER